MCASWYIIFIILPHTSPHILPHTQNVAEMEARKEELLKVQARLNEEQAAAKHVLNALTEGQRQFIEQYVMWLGSAHL